MQLQSVPVADSPAQQQKQRQGCQLHQLASWVCQSLQVRTQQAAQVVLLQQRKALNPSSIGVRCLSPAGLYNLVSTAVAAQYQRCLYHSCMWMP